MEVIAPVTDYKLCWTLYDVREVLGRKMQTSWRSGEVGVEDGCDRMGPWERCCDGSDRRQHCRLCSHALFCPWVRIDGWMDACWVQASVCRDWSGTPGDMVGAVETARG